MNKRQVFTKLLNDIDEAILQATDVEAGLLIDKVLDDYTLVYTG